MKTYVGIDNGVSGSIAIIKSGDTDSVIFRQTPTVTEQSYTKKDQGISRLDWLSFEALLGTCVYSHSKATALVLFERPLVNPRMFRTTMSAMRCLEAQLCIVERLNLPHMYIDSKEWQKAMLPSGIAGKPELKKASKDIGIRLFPQHKDMITKQKDADALLIAEYARRKGL